MMATSSSSRPVVSRWVAVSVAGLAVVVSVLTARFTGFDAAAMEHIVSLRSSRLSPLLHGINTLGDEGFAAVVVVAALAVLIRDRRWRDVLGFAAATGGILLWVDVVLKPLFDRHRPSELIVSTTGSSFPSGHVAGNLVLYLYLSTLLAERHPAAGAWSFRCAWTWVLLQGLSSVYLGTHYPSDILAGIGVGFLWLALILTWRAQPPIAKRNVCGPSTTSHAGPVAGQPTTAQTQNRDHG